MPGCDGCEDIGIYILNGTAFLFGVEPVIWIDGDADGGLDTGVGDVCRHRDGFFARFKRAR